MLEAAEILIFEACQLLFLKMAVPNLKPSPSSPLHLTPRFSFLPAPPDFSLGPFSLSLYPVFPFT